MKTINWTLFGFYGILVLLLALVSSGQTASYKRYQRPFVGQTAAIFSAPKVQKEICPMGTKWYDGKCRIPTK